MEIYSKIISELDSCSSKDKALSVSNFFKTGKNQYSEKDIFIGVNVPEQRKISKKYHKKISFLELEKLLQSNIHEHRFISLLMLIEKF